MITVYAVLNKEHLLQTDFLYRSHTIAISK